MKQVNNFSEHPIMVQASGLGRSSMVGFRFFVFHAGDHMETLKVVEHV